MYLISPRTMVVVGFSAPGGATSLKSYSWVGLLQAENATEKDRGMSHLAFESDGTLFHSRRFDMCLRSTVISTLKPFVFVLG